MTEKKRFTYSDVSGWNKDGFLNVMNGLDKKNNELKERIKELKKENKELQIEVLGQSEEIEIISDEKQQLKARNKRQYKLLNKITDLMCKRDWKALEQIVEDWEESDRLLQEEFKCYDGDVGD